MEKGYLVEVELHGASFKTFVEAKSWHEAVDYVLENVNVYVEDDEDEWVVDELLTSL